MLKSTSNEKVQTFKLLVTALKICQPINCSINNIN